MERRDMQYLNMRSLQERPVTLGELLLREERMESTEETETAPPRSMGRTMSPTRCLGPLVSGRPRRPRGRTLARPSTSTSQFEEEFGEAQQSQQRRRRTTSGPFSIPTLSRWRHTTAEARIRNLHSLLNDPQMTRRRGTSADARPRHRSLGRSDSPDLFFNPFSWRRRRSARGRQGRSRSSTNSRTMSRPLHGRSQRIRSYARVTPGGARMIDIYGSREEHRTSYRSMRNSRPHSGRPDPENRRNNANDNSLSDIPAAVRRFIDFAAEFIPVERPSPNAEPPEWSLDITAADFGPFAIGRSAVSRARSLAIMGVLAQVNDDSSDDDAATPRAN